MGRFEISLDKEGATYLPGQEVKGKIHIWNDKPKNVKGNLCVLSCRLYVYKQ